ncbi:MAG: AMIN-like domain-containing (lipo)protein [Streptosporangiaceae bacterium]
MKSVRTAVAAAALAIAVVPVTLAGCGSQPATPAATPSSPPTATAPATPGTTPAPPQAPSPGATSPAPSIRVVSSRLAYPWHWPNDLARPGQVAHSYPVPPMPELVQISVGYHAGEHGQLPYNRMSFTFTRAFPSYHFEWVSQLVGDASGKVIPLVGTDVLKVVFDQAGAHSADGTRSTIVSQPGRPIGYPSMTDYAQAGDYEGVLTYGIGYARAVPLSNPQTYVRAYEVEVVTAAGQHRYVVAIDINAAQHD